MSYRDCVCHTKIHGVYRKVIKALSPPTPDFYEEGKINVPFEDHENGAFILTHDCMYLIHIYLIITMQLNNRQNIPYPH